MSKERYFKHNGDFHRVDKGGNHFVNGKCVNPLADSELNVGDTIPTEGVYDEGNILKYTVKKPL